MRDADKKYATGISLLSANGVFEELLTMNWCLCRAPSNLFFILSSYPVVRFVKNEDNTTIIDGGFGCSNAEVSFPLSPTKCLFMNRKHTQKYRAANKEFVLEINRRTAWAADIFIILHIRSHYVKKLVKKSAVTLKLPKMDKHELYEEFEKRKIFE